MDGHVTIGQRIIYGGSQPFGLSRADRRQHLYVIGQTGTGKSTLLNSLIGQDIRNGEGLCLIDPHGDLVTAVLEQVPGRRVDDVVLVEPANLSHPVAWNPFYRVPPDERPLAASNLTASFRHVWRDSWGPRLEYLLYNAIAAILDAPDHLRPTILSIPRMLVDDRYRAAIVASVADPQVKFFWDKEFSGWSDRFLAEAISPVQNKVGAIVSAPALRNILGQWRPTIDLSDIMENGRILLLNLSKGQIGDDKANLIGSLFTASLLTTAMRRAGQAEEQRHDFHLYVDEFHNFGTDAFASVLSEARKFRLTLTLAHQYLAQLPEAIQDAVLGNAGSIACFRVGAEDAERLARYLGDYSPATLQGLSRGQICCRVLQGGEVTGSFLGRVAEPMMPSPGSADGARRQSRQRYARSRDTVERRIIHWLNRRSDFSLNRTSESN